jgi:hypothetical protein
MQLIATRKYLSLDYENPKKNHGIFGDFGQISC